jgi:hypothetical protein
MNAKSQSGMNFGFPTPMPDLMESAGKCWMDVMKQFMPDAADSGGNGNPAGMEAFRAWQRWYEDQCANRNGNVQSLQTIATAFIDQQKRCSELTLAWWKCSIAALRAIGGGIKNGDHPAQVMKSCMNLSEDYVRSCADFIAAQSEAVAGGAASVFNAPGRGSEKSKPVQAKAA